MQAQDILAKMRRMENSGLTRSQSETIADTIVAAVAPLATKDDLLGTKSDVSDLKTDVSELKSDVSELKADVSELKADVSGLKSEIRRVEDKLDIAVKHMATKKDLESMKVWLISGLLVVSGGLMTIAVSIVVFAFRTIA